MLTHQTKAVLNGIKQMTDNQDHGFAYSETYTDGENDLYCPSTDKVYDYSKYAGQIEAILEFLILQGYLSLDRSGRIPMYHLTYQGMHYGQINRIQAWEFTWTNVIIPVIVSAATAVITTLVTLLFVT